METTGETPRRWLFCVALLALQAASPAAAYAQIDADVSDILPRARAIRERHERQRSASSEVQGGAVRYARADIPSSRGAAAAAPPPIRSAGPVLPPLNDRQAADVARLRSILLEGGGIHPEDRGFVKENLGKYLPYLSKPPTQEQKEALQGWYGRNADKMRILNSENNTRYNCFGHASKITDRTVMTEGGSLLKFDRHFLDQGYVRTNNRKEASVELVMGPDKDGTHARTYVETKMPGGKVQKFAVDKHGFSPGSDLTISPVNKRTGRPVSDEGPDRYKTAGSKSYYYKHGDQKELDKAKQDIEKRERKQAEQNKQTGKKGQEGSGEQGKQTPQSQSGGSQQ